jgi:hypothetical protein
MSVNVGMFDRVLRVIVGVGMLAWALGYFPGVSASPWGWIGVIPLLTGLAGNCPAYSVFGLTTCRRA